MVADFDARFDTYIPIPTNVRAMPSETEAGSAPYPERHDSYGKQPRSQSILLCWCCCHWTSFPEVPKPHEISSVFCSRSDNVDCPTHPLEWILKHFSRSHRHCLLHARVPKPSDANLITGSQSSKSPLDNFKDFGLFKKERGEEKKIKGEPIIFFRRRSPLLTSN